MSKTIYIANDEWYPVWYLEKANVGTPAEVSDEEYKRIVKVFDDFELVQTRLKELNGQARK
jgi:hypothetical protein